MKTEIVALALFVYTFAAFGLSYIVGHAQISRPVRERLWGALLTDDYPPPRGFRQWLVTLVECPSCFGFWTGAATGLALALAGPYLSPPAWLAVLVGGCYTAGTNYALARATGLIGRPEET